MRILLLVAMDKELQLLSDIIENKEEIKIGDKIIKKGKAANNEIFISKCGIGKVNSAINAFFLINHLFPDIVINSGVAGGIGLKSGTILIADKVTYDDVWCGPGTKYGQADGCPLFFKPDENYLNKASRLNKEVNFGLICSGDKFISTPEEVDIIKSHFPDVKGVDMESASIAQVCFILQKPFFIMRIISDNPGEGDNSSQYSNFWNEAPLRTVEVIKSFISNL